MFQYFCIYIRTNSVGIHEEMRLKLHLGKLVGIHEETKLKLYLRLGSKLDSSD